MPGNTRPRTKFRRTFAIGNINGHYDQLMQCLEISNFDYNVDRLIVLGDVTDYGPDAARCIEELTLIRKKVMLHSIHDDMFNDWLYHGRRPDGWMQGGSMTLMSYMSFLNKPQSLRVYNRHITSDLHRADIPEKHFDLFLRRNFLFLDAEKRLFVSSDYDPTITKEDNLKNAFLLASGNTLWKALSERNEKIEFLEDIREIYISDYGVYEQKKRDTPENIGRVWNIGTSYRNAGRLTMINVETKEYYQSNLIQENIYF